MAVKAVITVEFPEGMRADEIKAQFSFDAPRTTLATLLTDEVRSALEWESTIDGISVTTEVRDDD